METIKTACMVIVLMAIGYGVYTVLNQPEQIPPEVAGQAIDQLDLSLPDFSTAPGFDGGQPRSASPDAGGDSAPAYHPGGGPARSFDPSQFQASRPEHTGNSGASNSGYTNPAAPPLALPGGVAQGGASPAYRVSDTGEEADNVSNAQSIEDPPGAERKIAWADHLDTPSASGTRQENPPVVEARTIGEAGPETTAASGPQRSGSIYSRGADDSSAAGSQVASHSFADSATREPEVGRSSGDGQSFDEVWSEAQQLLGQGEMGEALRLLTPWRNRPSLTPSQKTQLDSLLSQLAGTVVYSTQHVIEQPYILSRGETLGEIARRYNVPTILLQRINGISTPDNLEPGEKLKVIHGPFSATLDATNRELSLTVNGCYAGRFPVEIASDSQLQPGQHQVIRKEENPEYFDSDSGQIWKAGDDRNPYGSHALHLDGGIVLHGDGGEGGSVGLSPRDIEDIFGILSVGSRVTIVR